MSATASLARDPDLLAETAVNGKAPDLAMIVHVREAFFHCGKSMIRSGLWERERWGSIDGLPTYAQRLKHHGALTDPLASFRRWLSATRPSAFSDFLQSELAERPVIPSAGSLNTAGPRIQCVGYAAAVPLRASHQASPCFGARSAIRSARTGTTIFTGGTGPHLQ